MQYNGHKPFNVELRTLSIIYKTASMTLYEAPMLMSMLKELLQKHLPHISTYHLEIPDQPGMTWIAS